MTIDNNKSLKAFNTFGIDEMAEQFVAISNESELLVILTSQKNNKINIIGGGSNILLTQTLENLTIINQLKGIEVLEENEDDVFIKFMSGENWHECVLWAVAKNYGGIENLSLIPGTIGASPIQNIGAYGVELKDVFHALEAIDLKTLEKKIFHLDECAFGYRDSIFKRNEKGNWFILNVTLRLSKKPMPKLNYGNIKEELTKLNIQNPSIEDVSNAVISIRQSKLPDPKVVGNAGSFFKNPVITFQQFEILKSKFPNMPSFPNDGGIKIPAAWLIEYCNWKGIKRGDYGVHDKQALVLVNFGNAKGVDILALSAEIITYVQLQFNIELEREVNVW